MLIQLDNVYWLDEIYRCFIPTFYFPSDLFLIIGFESEYESDISSIQTNNSFSSLSEIELQWDDDLDFKQTKKRFWSENCKKTKTDVKKIWKIWNRKSI